MVGWALEFAAGDFCRYYDTIKEESNKCFIDTFSGSTLVVTGDSPEEQAVAGESELGLWG